MNKEYTIFLKHILESIEAIEGYVKDLSEEMFLKSREKQDAIIRRLEIIGEAVKNLPEDFKKEHPDIAWNKAMGTRNSNPSLFWYRLGNSLEYYCKKPT